MKHTKIAALWLLLAIVTMMFAACSTCKTTSLQEETVAPPAAITQPAPKPAPKTMVKEAALPAEKILGIGDKLEPIFFDFDKHDLKDLPRETLAKHAQWLKNNPGAVVRIEGNCDERGANEYNLALGERRAASAKKYLIYLGISPKQLETISYGEEKPVCSAHYEGCWWKNRRDDFVVVAK
ncbi:MAG: peptidoglycan-associated lipoprotein Pal [Deltaproteobacteria bacterium]|nr:peptidoglycan-associated lipoprotein Pal [Candidatus Anaeroferrophillus wilburensis]MBN2888095.1 peptidoglycan-associated lipoprotein Pal [Deltaproteobacteria bacterium]